MALKRISQKCLNLKKDAFIINDKAKFYTYLLHYNFHNSRPILGNYL